MILAVCLNPAVDTLIYLNDIVKGSVNRIQKEIPFPGGKGVHVGLGVKELGEDVTVLGIWGGLTGQWIKDELNKKGIKCIGPTVDAWTRVCQTIKSKSAFDETEILGVGPKIDDIVFSQFMSDYQNILTNVEIVSISGSCPPGTPDDAYAQMIRIANAQQIPTVIDCTGTQFENAIKENPTACHLNYSEAKTISGKLGMKDCIEYLKMYFEIPVITKGAEGLVISKNDNLLRTKVGVDKVVSPVGSGDAVTAALVVGVKNGYDIEKIAKLAVSCGAANCIRPELGLFYKDDVFRLEKEAIINVF